MSLYNYLRLLLFFLLSLFYSDLYAAHITGGQISYRHVTDDSYVVKLDLFRDCEQGGAMFDLPLTIGVYERYPSGLAGPEVFSIDSITVEEVTPLFDDCLEMPHLNCIEKGTYEFTMDLPVLADLESYIIVYQRCCRSNIDNILESQSSGISIWKEIKINALVLHNSSPEISANVHFDICPDNSFEFNIAATDAEGDSLSYNLGYMFSGGGPAGATEPGNAFDCDGVIPSPPCSPPFDTLQFLPGFVYDLPLGEGSTLELDPISGNITGVSSLQGIYIAGIEVQEYRGNNLLSTTYQELTFRIKMPSSNENIVQSGFSFYPNPTSNSITINLPSSTTDYSLFLRDLTGKLIKEIKYLRGSQHILDLNQYHGVLVLELKSEDLSFIDKIICI